jgi:hypothetical protein
MDEADPRAKLEPFQALIGEWTIEMTHPMVADTVVRGRTTYEWLEGGRFLIQRAVNEHPGFPDSLCVIGVMEGDIGTALLIRYAAREQTSAGAGPEG